MVYATARQQVDELCLRGLVALEMDTIERTLLGSLIDPLL